MNLRAVLSISATTSRPENSMASFATIGFSRLHAKQSSIVTATNTGVAVAFSKTESCAPSRRGGRVGPTRLDQFVQWMHDHSTVDVLDMRPAFLLDKLKDSGPMDPLYTPHGTHWTSRGVYTAYRAIVSHLAATHPGVVPLEFADFHLIELPLRGGHVRREPVPAGHPAAARDQLERKGGGKFLPVTGHWPPRFQRTKSSLPNLLPHTLVFHDSLGPFIACTLAESFETLDMSEGLFNSKRIVPGETKIVIEMFVERYLTNHAPVVAPDEVLLEEDPNFARLPHELLTLDPKLDSTFPATGVTLDYTESGAMRFQRTGQEYGLHVGPVHFPAQGKVLLRIDVESDRPGSLAVLWRSMAGGDFKRRDAVSIELAKQRKAHTIELPTLGGDVELLLRPGEVDVPVTVHAFALRSSDLP